jgi:hypothetical protein
MKPTISLQVYLAFWCLCFCSIIQQSSQDNPGEFKLHTTELFSCHVFKLEYLSSVPLLWRLTQKQVLPHLLPISPKVFKVYFNICRIISWNAGVRVDCSDLSGLYHWTSLPRLPPVLKTCLMDRRLFQGKTCWRRLLSCRVVLCPFELIILRLILV